MRCDEVAGRLAEVAGGQAVLPRAERRHVEACLRCQAEVVQYRKLLRAMRALRVEVLEPAPGMVSDILAYVEEAGERTALRSILGDRKLAYLGGLAVATAAGAVGALIVTARSRRAPVRLVT